MQVLSTYRLEMAAEDRVLGTDKAQGVWVTEMENWPVAAAREQESARPPNWAAKVQGG